MENSKRTWPTETTKQGSYGLTRTEVASKVPSRVFTIGSVYMVWLLAWSFVGLLKVGVVSLILLLGVETVFLLLGCLMQPQYEDF